MAPRTDHLFNDHLFRAPSERIAAGDVFAVSDAMKRFVRTEIGGPLHGGGIQQRFAEALYTKGELRLEYESVRTRNAAEAFEARTGNCLSLVIMTAALAKEIGLPVRYQQGLCRRHLEPQRRRLLCHRARQPGLGRRQIDGDSVTTTAT